VFCATLTIFEFSPIQIKCDRTYLKHTSEIKRPISPYNLQYTEPLKPSSWTLETLAKSKKAVFFWWNREIDKYIDFCSNVSHPHPLTFSFLFSQKKKEKRKKSFICYFSRRNVLGLRDLERDFQNQKAKSTEYKKIIFDVERRPKEIQIKQKSSLKTLLK